MNQNESLNESVDELETDNQENIDLSEKAIKKEKERQRIIQSAATGRCDTLLDKVAVILRDDMESRNCDIELSWNYWRTFQRDILGDELISYEKSFKLKRLTSLSRVRAKIQNEHKLFLADEEIRKMRGTLEEDYREKMLEEKASYPFYSAFIDESGKTSDYLIVGGPWLLDRSSYLQAVTRMMDWKASKAPGYEFHFKEMDKQYVDLYKAFAGEFVASNPMLGFSAIIHPRQGAGYIQGAIEDLTFLLIQRSVISFHDSGKAVLPRRLQVWIDDEHEKSDKIKLENIKSRLKAEDFSKHGNLRFDEFQPVNSEGNDFIQIADLFVSSLNRVLNHKGGNKNHKDEFAEFFLRLLGWDGVISDKMNFEGDFVTIVNI